MRTDVVSEVDLVDVNVRLVSDELELEKIWDKFNRLAGKDLRSHWLVGEATSTSISPASVSSLSLVVSTAVIGSVATTPMVIASIMLTASAASSPVALHIN